MKESPRAKDVLRILLVEDDRGDTRQIRDALANADAHWGRFELEVFDRLASAIPRLSKGDVAAILLDFSLPDNRGLDALFNLREHAPAVPIIVLTTVADQAWGIKALNAGAQDYLVKGKVDGALLARSLRYAIERRRLETSLQQMTLVDDLCGLYNRRGFFRFADQQLKLIRRMGKRALLVVADIQGLKAINDAFGHAAGDVAITDAAGLLKHTFRDSDVIGRLGADEFVILAIGVADDGPRSILRRLAKSLVAYNEEPDRRFRLSFNLGFSDIDPGDGSGLDHLLAEADRDLHGRKRRRSKVHAEITL
jgi:two-component system, cell cycle response regulator